MNLLHLDSSILGHNSVSRQLSIDIVNRCRVSHPDLTVTYRDLASQPIPHLSGAFLAASSSDEGSMDSSLHHDLALSTEVLDEFLAAEMVVVGVALYNFTIATQLKAWVDRIAVKGKTFRYSDRGPEGLCGGKKVVLAVARGGYYGSGSPAAAFEHAETYLRAIFGFIGVTAIQVVVAEGLNVGPEQRTQSLTSAAQQIAVLDV